MKKAELLAPCGSMECVKAAVNNGADAVYLGGQLFNARAYASNFDNEALKEVCDYCHTYGVKVYITVNTLYKDSEFEALLGFVDYLNSIGVDGLIMQDVGAIKLVRQYWPDLPVHVSTQLTTNSLSDVKEFEKMGIRTVVLSRELSLNEIRTIASNTDIRIETFIHGALCVSYSGQCLMSSVLGNRSGNRGRCAQNCRLIYDLNRNGKKVASGHLLSTKDICTLDVLPQILEAGVASLKIEGRMKPASYVAGVTRIYRKYLDLYYSGKPYVVEQTDREELLQLFNRGYFSQGYYRTHSGSDMMCWKHPRSWGLLAGEVTRYDRSKNIVSIRFTREMIPGDGIEIWTDDEEGTGCFVNKPCKENEAVSFKIEGAIRPGQKVYQTYNKRLEETLKQTFIRDNRRVSINGRVKIRADEPVSLTLSNGTVKATARGGIVARAISQPITQEALYQQLSRMGNTPFVLEKLDIDMDDDCFMDKASLNALRNSACELLLKKIRDSYRRTEKEFHVPEYSSSTALNKVLTACVATVDQYRTCANHPAIKEIYVDCRIMDSIDPTETDKKVYVRLPRISREMESLKLKALIDKITDSKYAGTVVCSLGQYHQALNTGKPILCDFTDNVINRHSEAFWLEKGADRIALSPESNILDINASPFRDKLEMVLYGKLPLMVTHQCPVGNFVGKKKNHQFCREKGHKDSYTLTSMGNEFKVECDCSSCLATIRQSQPLWATDLVGKAEVGYLRMDFTDESQNQTSRIIESFVSALDGKTEETKNTVLYNREIQ